MKHTRKKMLLSSVAMLLVALVALGSATFAWFTVNKTVTATNINVKAITTAGIEISNTGSAGTYTNTVSFADSSVALKPISWAADTTKDGYVPSGNVDGTTGAYSGTAYKSIGSVPSVTATDPAKNITNGYWSAYKVWVRSAAEADGTTYTAKNVEAKVEATYSGSVTAKDGTKFVRAKLVDETTAANSKNFWDAAAGTATAISGTDSSASGGTTTGISFVQYGTYGDVTATAASATGKEYTLYVWYDGADTDCKQDATDALADIVITFQAKDM